MTNDQPISVSLVSLGCPKNLVDSEKMLGRLAEAGCLVAAPMDDADVIVVNTCGFLAAARDEAMGVIAEALACKASGRTRRVVVAGCLVERDAEGLFELAPGIDAIVGLTDRDEIVQAVTGEARILVHPFAGGVHGDSGRFRLTPRHTAYLRISEGCSHRCTFCTIPDIRGPFRSKPPGDVVAEAAELIADGAFELNVIAQDTTGYGTDLGDDVNLAGLLRRLDGLDGAGWIRLLYTYPRGFDDELIAAISESECVVRYVDIPLQHISDSVLKRMGRRVERRRIEDLLDRLRSAGIALRTTFIAGFPGETDAEFAELLAFVEEFEFDALGVFEYSPEPGTPAVNLPEQVDDETKARRAEAVMAAQQQIAFAANQDAVGQVIDVLVDGIDPQGRCVGRHAAQAPEIDSVSILTEPLPPGELIAAEVVGFEDYDLIVRARES